MFYYFTHGMVTILRWWWNNRLPGCFFCEICNILINFPLKIKVPYIYIPIEGAITNKYIRVQINVLLLSFASIPLKRLFFSKLSHVLLQFIYQKNQPSPAFRQHRLISLNKVGSNLLNFAGETKYWLPNLPINTPHTRRSRIPTFQQVLDQL